MNLQNKTIALTGATGGIGRKLAEKLDKLGAKLILISSNKIKLNKLASELENVLFQVIVDLNNESSINKMIKDIKTKHEKLDIIINCAGIGVYEKLEDIQIEDWNKSMNVNVKAPFLITQGLLDNLHRSDNPVVMNIGSGAGTTGMSGRSAYVASKFALRGLSLSLTEELESKDIKVTLITLGSTLTGFGKPSLEEKKKLHRGGKAYFTSSWVAEQLVQILQSDSIESEYTLYPSE